MCDIFGGGSSGPDPAEVARQQEAERAARVRKGTKSINRQFAQFGPEFYQGIEQSALDFYNPQLQDQYDDTYEALVKNLARFGNLSGSVGARKLGELEEELATQQGRIADKARGYAQAAKADVEGNYSSLIQNLAATADPFAAANAARAQVQALSAPPEFSPVEKLSKDLLNIGRTYVVAASPEYGFQNPASILFPQDRKSVSYVR